MWIVLRLIVCRGILAFALLTNADAGVAQPLDDQIANLFQRPVSELEALIKVRGDALDPRITVSSYGVTQIVEKGPSGNETLETAFLRAFINRADGEITAQVYAVIDYDADRWSNYDSAVVLMPSALIEKTVDQISSDVRCYNSYLCRYHEEVIFPISFEDLEGFSQQYNPKTPILSMQYRLSSHYGDVFNDAIPINEIAAFVHVVRNVNLTSDY